MTIPKVLIVDDDPGLRRMLTEALRSSRDSFELKFAENGKMAKELLGRMKIDLVVTDLLMPVMDGFQLISHMMDRYPEIPRLVMSSSQSAITWLQRGKSDFEGVLTKPVDPKALVSKMLETLEKREDVGIMRGLSLKSFIQLIDLEQKSCTLRIRNKQTRQEGLLSFDHGQLFDATEEDQTGVEAALGIFQWNDIAITYRDGCDAPFDNIRIPIQELLWESSVQQDLKKSSPTFPQPTTPSAPSHSKNEIQDDPHMNTVLDIGTTWLKKIFVKPRPEDAQLQTEQQPLVETLTTASPPPPPLPPAVTIIDTNDFDDLMDLGIKSFREGKLPAAKAYFEKAAKVRPDDSRVRYNLKLITGKLEEI